MSRARFHQLQLPYKQLLRAGLEAAKNVTYSICQR